MTGRDWKRFHEERKAANAADLARAEQEALANGKEPFDLDALRVVYSEDTLRAREEGLRAMYYIFNRDLRTMEELVELIRRNAPWEDSS